MRRLEIAVVERVVRGLAFSAVVAGLLAVPGPGATPACAQPAVASIVPNNTPLFFGMDAQQVRRQQGRRPAMHAYQARLAEAVELLADQ